MESAFDRLIKVNTQGRVFVTCQSHGVADPSIIGYYAEILEQEIRALMSETSTPTEFQRILEEQILWLESELDQAKGDNPPQVMATAAETNNNHIQSGEAVNASVHNDGGHKRPSGYVPEAKSMPEHLKDRRSAMEHLLDNDCITLKLVTPAEAKQYKHGLLGKDPERAEEELVASLRNVLHEQLREFIRKHNGGPWAGDPQQHALRVNITKTRTLHSLVTLARELLGERKAWLLKTNNSMTGRLFGDRLKMDK